MKSVSEKKYDYEYYKNIYGISNHNKPLKKFNFKQSHLYTASLLKLKKSDTVVDFACGTGDLSILLAYKYSCKVMGIEYSPNGILLANRSKKMLERSNPKVANKIRFIFSKNENLPNFKKIAAVYLCDVIEHLYDGEINLVLKKFISWNDKIILVIHTDNNIFLRYIRPIIDLVGLILNKISMEEIKDRNKRENQVHINLTTAHQLTSKLKKYGFKKQKLMYSPVTKERIKNQLSKLGSITILVEIIYTLSGLFSFFLPSIYAVYKREK